MLTACSNSIALWWSWGPPDRACGNVDGRTCRCRTCDKLIDWSATNEDVVERIRELTGGNGADVVVEAVGLPKTYEQAFYARDLAGTVVLVGVPTPDMKIELPLIDIFGRGGSLKSSWYGDCLPSRDFPMLIDLYLQGRLNLDGFVSETIGLGDVEEAFHKMERGEVLRSVVEIP